VCSIFRKAASGLSYVGLLNFCPCLGIVVRRVVELLPLLVLRRDHEDGQLVGGDLRDRAGVAVGGGAVAVEREHEGIARVLLDALRHEEGPVHPLVAGIRDVELLELALPAPAALRTLRESFRRRDRRRKEQQSGGDGEAVGDAHAGIVALGGVAHSPLA
jgi:hypothetical protein